MRGTEDPASQDLHSWLGATLITTYPDLAAPPPPGSPARNRFEVLVDERLIPPVLDGLDEIRELARQAAIARINKELKAAGHSRNLSPGASVVMAEGYGSTPGAAQRFPRVRSDQLILIHLTSHKAPSSL